MKQLLETIKSGEFQYIYKGILNKAALWMMAGFIEKANQLLEELWSTGIENAGEEKHPDFRYYMESLLDD